jgi:hypothetical protein
VARRAGLDRKMISNIDFASLKSNPASLTLSGESNAVVSETLGDALGVPGPKMLCGEKKELTDTVGEGGRGIVRAVVELDFLEVSTGLIYLMPLTEEVLPQVSVEQLVPLSEAGSKVVKTMVGV